MDILNTSSLEKPLWQWSLLSISLLVVFAANPYVKSAILFPNYTVFFIAPASWLVYCLVKNAKMSIIMTLALLASGIREDAGIWVFFLTMITLFLPSSISTFSREIRKKAVICGLFCLAFSISTAFFLSTQVSAAPASKYPAAFNWNYFSLAASAWSHPELILQMIGKSGFWNLNHSFLWIGAMNPAAWLLANLPAWPLFISGEPAISKLLHGNMSFMLPGFFLAAVCGIHLLFKVIGWAAQRFSKRFKYLLWAPLLWALAAAVFTVYGFTSTANPAIPFKLKQVPERIDFSVQIPNLLQECPKIRSVAVDAKNVVFVPNSHQRYLIANYLEADAVFVMGQAEDPYFKKVPAEKLDEQIATSGFFRLHRMEFEYKFYVKKNLRCPAEGSARRRSGLRAVR